MRKNKIIEPFEFCQYYLFLNSSVIKNIILLIKTMILMNSLFIIMDFFYRIKN
jgi:hypothetical protein